MSLEIMGRVLCCSSGWWLRYFWTAVLILIKSGDERDVRLIKLLVAQRVVQEATPPSRKSMLMQPAYGPCMSS